MQNKNLFFNKMNGSLAVLILLLILLNPACCEEECDVPECNISLADGAVVTVTSNVSGGGGTQITPDSIDQASVTDQSAVVSNKVLRIGQCHQVLGYGHTWSSTSATPRIGIDEFSDYEDNINFNDEVATIMSGLSSGTTYWVRSWVSIEYQNCTRERIIFYNDNISQFTTL